MRAISDFRSHSECSPQLNGVDGALLCHLLLSVNDDPAHGAAMLRFRCAGPVRGPKYYCHKLNLPHYRGQLDLHNVRFCSTFPHIANPRKVGSA